jgi:hypothetical protein
MTRTPVTGIWEGDSTCCATEPPEYRCTESVGASISRYIGTSKCGQATASGQKARKLYKRPPFLFSALHATSVICSDGRDD